jgi:predicted MFS family arabinose efflux permease
MGSVRENQHTNGKQLQRLLWVLSAATFLIFFQAYMVAPLIPRLSGVFGVSNQEVGLLIPAYMIPYGVLIVSSVVALMRLRLNSVWLLLIGAVVGLITPALDHISFTA